jgi:hypothetical protein
MSAETWSNIVSACSRSVRVNRCESAGPDAKTNLMTTKALVFIEERTFNEYPNMHSLLPRGGITGAMIVCSEGSANENLRYFRGSRPIQNTSQLGGRD